MRKRVRGYSIDFMDGPKWHTLLKSRGYPVVPTYRYDADNSVEYVTDLRRGGTHRVIDFCGSKDNYKEVFVSNIVELEKDVDALLEKSANDGLVINEPNIFFDVEISTGVTKVLIGETRELGYDSGNDDNVPSREAIFKHNSWVLKEHMDRLKSITVKQ